MPGTIPKVIYCYRITHFKNIPFILQNGMHSPASKIKDPGYINIGKKDIISKRERKLIEVPPYGRIHDYVSFYFGPKSPMLYSIHKGNSDTNCTQSDIVYIVTSIPILQENGSNLVFTTGQAIMELSTQHNSLKDLTKIDWDIIFGKYWFDDPPKYTDRARKRMAELLVHQTVPVNCILEFGVMNKATLQVVEKMVYNAGLLIPVKLALNWYY